MLGPQHSTQHDVPSVENIPQVEKHNMAKLTVYTQFVAKYNNYIRVFNGK